MILRAAVRSCLRGVIVLSSLALPSTVQAQTVVAGQVLHRDTRATLAKVLVELLNAGDSVLATATSAADGTFMVEAPGGGTFRVRLTPPDADAMVSDTLSVATGDYVARGFLINPVPRAFLAAQVDRPVTPTRGLRGPRYPTDLRDAGVTGCAFVQFVVDERGLPDTTTFRVLRFSHIEFAHAVRAALPDMRYVPAELGGRKVRQLVEVPFDFTIDHSRIPSGDQRAPVVRGPPPPRENVSPRIPSPMPTMCGARK